MSSPSTDAPIEWLHASMMHAWLSMEQRQGCGLTQRFCYDLAVMHTDRFFAAVEKQLAPSWDYRRLMR